MVRVPHHPTGGMFDDEKWVRDSFSLHRYAFKLVRHLSGAPPPPNPWRITHLKTHPFWFDGKMGTLKSTYQPAEAC